MDFWAGYLSGAVGILVGNPLDIVKVRLQQGTLSNLAKAPASFQSAREALRGLPAPVLTYGALNAILFTSYNKSLSLLTPGYHYSNPPHSGPHPSYSAHFLSGVLAGLATFVVSAPTELVKCRAQMFSTEAPTSSWAALRQTLHQRGFRGLYHGGVVTSIRDAVGYGFYFWTYELCKDAWDRAAFDAGGPPADGPGMGAAKVLLCGGLAGVATWVSIFPLDVIKTRVQTQEYFTIPTTGPSFITNSARASGSASGPEQQPLLGRQSPSLKGAWFIAKEAYRAEGTAVFFRGITVCCLRAFIVNAVQWGTYEYTMSLAS